MISSDRGRFSAVLRSNRQLSPTSFLLVFERPEGFPDAYPGQFVSIRPSDSIVPLLRRPYSILDLTGAALSLLVKVVGRGSASIASRRPGETVDLVGPLGGAAFPVPNGNAVFVAGGTGLAPLLFAARMWRRKRINVETVFLYGAGSRDELLSDLVAKSFSACRFATLDGSAGYHGDVAALCRDFMNGNDTSALTLYSCGPRGMVRTLVDCAGGRFGDHYTSLESIMACGVGACRGCTVPLTVGGTTVLKTVCSDGTVFRANDIAWEEWEE